MNRENEDKRSDERIYEEVYGDDLEKPIDNNLRYSNWRNYVIRPTSHETQLGTTFEPSVGQENQFKRLKRLQDQVKTPNHILRKKSYEEKSVVLSYYLNKEHLNDVYELASHIKNFISDRELMPTLLALYELKLFIETEQLIHEKTYKDILQDHYYNERETKFSRPEVSTKAFSTIFFHKLGKFIRDLYTQEGKILDFQAKIVKIFSRSVRAFVDAYLYENMKIDEKYKSMFSTDKFEELKFIRAPRFFTKVMFIRNVKQQLQNIYLRLHTKHLITKTEKETLLSVGNKFAEIYLQDYNKLLKSSYAFGLTLIKELNPELLIKISQLEDISKYSRISHNFKHNNKIFFEKIIKDYQTQIHEIIVVKEELLHNGTIETVSDPEILYQSVLDRDNKEEELLEKIENVTKLSLEDQVWEFIWSKIWLGTFSKYDRIDGKDDSFNDPVKLFKNYTHFLGVKYDELLTDHAYMTWFALYQLELLFHEQSIFRQDKFIDLLMDLEDQYEYKTKYKKKDLKILYHHRLYRLVTALYEGDSTKVDTTNEYIRQIRENIRSTVHTVIKDCHENYGPKNEDLDNKGMYRRSMAARVIHLLLFEERKDYIQLLRISTRRRMLK
ncbi:MAG: hypothetical protein HeimC3_16110 [Candidatus Heimdallarchaeota archaeon LC_3]|nr:MAG: hypothetical protein HeimC3_16110 [Candidatus Heimdallarchaeota archaeon LC_3]